MRCYSCIPGMEIAKSKNESENSHTRCHQKFMLCSNMFKTKPTKTKTNTKATSWLLQDPKTSGPEVQAEMCSKHINSI